MRVRPVAWLVGFVVISSLGVAVALMLRDTLRDRVRLQAAVGAGQAAQDPPPAVPEPASVPQLPIRTLEPRPDRAVAGDTVRGVVRGPDGRPLGGATVVFYRAATAWPEWRVERLDQAITHEDGTFQFRADRPYGLLLGVDHPAYAGAVHEVPVLGGDVELRVEPGFEVSGFVLNDAGAPVPNARVVLESVPGEERRAESTRTAADGRYRFTNLAAGPVRLVAHHDSWQPATTAPLVVGDRRRVDLRFERPTMTPLRGKVLSVTSQQPIAGATVQLVPINQKLGLVEPISASTGADGDFVLSGLPRGSMRLLVRHPEHGTVMRTQSIGAVASELTIELPPRSVVEGQLVAERFDDVIVGGEVLELQDLSGELQQTTVEQDGRFRFDRPSSPGWAELRVVGRGFAFQRTYVSSVPVRVLESPTTSLELPVLPASTIRGRLLGADGQPLAGARLVRGRLLVESAKVIGDAAWQLDLSAVGSQVAELFGSDRDELLAVSGRDGRFEIRGLLRGLLLARAEHAGSGSRWLRLLVPSPGSPQDMGDVVLPSGGGISGRVLRGNRPFVGATVTAVGDDCQSSAVTDGDGVYRLVDLVPGRYSVRARIPAQPTGSNEAVVEVQPGRTRERVDIVLEVGRVVRGVVTSNDGQPLPGAIVSVRGAPGLMRATDGNGSFVLELPPRAVSLQVSIGDRSRQRVVPVALDQESVAVQLDAPPTCTLQARVAGLPARKRLAGARLRLTSLGGDDDGRTRWVELSDGELSWGLCPSGRVRVELWCDGYAPFVAERWFAANQPHDLGEILLEPGGRLRGVIRDENGAPVANAVALLGEESDLDLYEPSVRSAVDGTFELLGVTGRSSRLVVRAPGFAARTVDLQLPRDVLVPEPLEVVLERGATIEVRVADELAPDGGIVQLRRQGRTIATAELDERGRAWFANRSAGRYTVRLFAENAPEQAVEVVPGASLVLLRLVTSDR